MRPLDLLDRARHQHRLGYITCHNQRTYLEASLHGDPCKEWRLYHSKSKAYACDGGVLISAVTRMLLGLCLMHPGSNKHTDRIFV
jgi:hypothetical protein